MLKYFYVVNGLQVWMQMQELDVFIPHDFQKKSIAIMYKNN